MSLVPWFLCLLLCFLQLLTQGMSLAHLAFVGRGVFISGSHGTLPIWVIVLGRMPLPTIPSSLSVKEAYLLVLELGLRHVSYGLWS